MSATYERFERYAARLLELQRAGAAKLDAPAKLKDRYARAAKRYFGYVKKHPRLARRLNREMKAAYASNKNPVRRRGNLVIVSGPHSHAYPARKTRVKKRRRNDGMGVSDLVMTPAYGAFGGAIQEGNYVGGPMHWMRRGIRNPKKAPRVIIQKAGPRAWSVRLPSPHVPGGVPYGRVEERDGKFYYSGPHTHGEARYSARSLSDAVLKLLNMQASWIGHGTRAAWMKSRGNPRRNPVPLFSEIPVRSLFHLVQPSSPTVETWRKIDGQHAEEVNSGDVTLIGPNYKAWPYTGKYGASYKNPLVHGYSRKSFDKNVKRERGRGVSKKRALGIAFATGRRAAKRAGVRIPKFLQRNPLDPFLHSRIAKALGWTVAQTQSMSLASLRELVRPVDPELAKDITREMGGGHHVSRRNPADTTAARELVLYIENDGDLYRQQTYPIIQNLARKTRKGTYDHKKAVKLWAYLAENGAKKYARDFGGTCNHIFTPDTRRAVAAMLADNYLEAVQYEVKKQSNKNPRYRQSPPGAPSLAASRASSWRSLTTSFPGASISSVTARGNPRNPKRRVTNAVLLRHVAIAADRLRRGVGSEVELRMTKDKARYRGISKARIDAAVRAGYGPVGNPKRRRNKNSGEMSFWKATIYSPTGKPIHRQVIQNTRAGAVASAKKLARTNPKVALDGPFKSRPAC